MTEFLLLFFVFVGELGLAGVVYFAKAVLPEYTVAVFFAIYGLQFMTATIQGGISDHSVRKKSLFVAFNAVLLGQVFFLLAFKQPLMLLGAVILYGFLGNITPIARAALADTALRKNFRLSVALSTIAIAIGWILMACAAYYVSPFASCLLVSALCFLCNFLVCYVNDPEDKKAQSSFSIKKEISLILSLLKHPEIFWGLIGYLIAEIGFYQIFARGKGEINDPLVTFIITTWVIGYVLGAVIQHFIFRKGKEESGILWGGSISIFAMIFLIVFSKFEAQSTPLLAVTNALFSLGFGFFVPCLFAMVFQKYRVHLQGKIYGLVDAVDSLALMIAIAVHHYMLARFSLTILMSTSLFFSVLALLCFFKTIKCVRKA